MAQLTGHFQDHIIDAPPIHLEGLAVRFNRTDALLGISAEIEPGKRIAIVGPNGAGKTTLLQVIAGVLTPDRGNVQVYGHHPQRHVCIAYVPQRSQADWDFPVNVRETVMMGRIRKIGLFRWPTQKDWDFVDSSLEQVGMQSHADRQIGELSGGQQQRVFLARALAQDASLYLMDEPFAGVDAATETAIVDVLRQLKADGKTVICVHHDLQTVTQYFDHAMVLNMRCIAAGDVRSVMTEEILQAAYGGRLAATELNAIARSA
jgi:ABC-type Mn2+/Zn2+ transport system ATPase subunit